MVKLSEKDLFVVYSPAGSRDHFLVKQKGAHLSWLSDAPGFVIHPFRLGGEVEPVKIRPDQFLLNPTLDIKLLQQRHQNHITKRTYLDYITKAIGFIHERALEKIVLSRVMYIPIASSDVMGSFDLLKEQYPEVLVYLFNIPGQGAWMGATPEVLLRWDEERAYTMALAGTRRLEDGGQDWSAKNLKEHEHVVRYIDGVLKEHRVEYRSGTVHTMRAGAVEHLCTPFEMWHAGLDLERLAEHLHPTPAVCGIPPKKVFEDILLFEPFDRRYYTGYLGPVHLHKESYLYVNLRCMEFGTAGYYLYVGGGIVDQSDPEIEWEETELKARTLLSALG